MAMIKQLIKKNKFDFLKQLINSEYTIVAILLLLIIIASPIVPKFLTLQNFSNILTRTTVSAMAAIGMTFVIISGGIDLSIGGMVILSAYIGVETLVQNLGINIYLAALIMLGLGAIMGMLNGISVVVLRMPPFIATLAMMNITRGLAHFIYQAKTVFNLPKSWSIFGSGKLIGLPVPIIIFLIFFIIAYLILKYTLFGRSIYAAGSNAKAAWLAGVNVKKIVFLAYVISGITAGATAVILTSRLFSVVGSLGSGLELDVISAVVIGGTSLLGGEGTILGSLIGSLIIESVGNILVLARISPFFTLVAKGLVLWLAVLIDMARKGYVFKKSEE
jgi:ribose/xylose/arabinose/galactoside ABC-type transport system permease subunit